MIETLKQNKEFREWFVKNYEDNNQPSMWVVFISLPFDMQYGVILKWLREQGWEIDEQFNTEGDTSAGFYQVRVFKREDYYSYRYGQVKETIFEDLDFDTALQSAIASCLTSIGSLK